MEAKDTDCYDKPSLYSYREVANLMIESRKVGMREVVSWLERYKKIKVPKYQLKEWEL